MLGKPGNGEISLSCDSVTFPEFPELLFGTHQSGRTYFDASIYLSKTKSDKNFNSFITQYRYQIQALCEGYGIPDSKVVLVNQEGHYLVDGAFVFLFIAFVVPNFLAHVCDRMFELFQNGVCVSDTYLVASARGRLPSEVLQLLISENEQTTK